MRSLALLLVLAAPVLANERRSSDPAVACVQGQLNALGLQAGPVDGIWGPRTQAAARDAAGDIPVYGRYRAAVLCRQLGLRDTRLRRYWPAQSQPPVLLRTQGLGASSVAVLEAAFTRTRARLAEIFGLTLPGQVDVVAASSEQDLRALWRDLLGPRFRERGFDAIHGQSCKRTDTTGGFTSGLAIALCLPQGAPEATTEGRFLIETTVAHEYFHTVQRQLVGEPRPDSLGNPVAFAGPEWLIEGSATYISVRTTLPQEFMADAFARLEDKVRGTMVDLSELESFAVRATRLEALYDHGTYAAWLLVQGAGERSLVRFYELIGLGRDWRSAFEAAFGETVAAFYRRYREAGANGQPGGVQ